MLIQCWGQTTFAHRVQVARALGGLGDRARAAIPALTMATDGDERLRDAAIAAIEQIEADAD
jgi:hypothetical protein